MRANGRYPTKFGWSAIMGALLAVSTTSCSDITPMDPESDMLAARGRPGQADEIRFTGTVDLVWPGGKGMNAPQDDRYAQASLAAFPGIEPGSPGSGNFAYRVIAPSLSADCGGCHEEPPTGWEQPPEPDHGTLHREIGVKLYYVDIHDEDAEVRFLGEVVSDTKPCGGTGQGGGGCSHDDGTTHDDGGCSHDDGTTGGHAEPGGSGGSGSHPNGSDCRIGQIVLGWAHDAGKSRTETDRISWKWFYPNAPKVQQVNAAISSAGHVAEELWPCKLCEKEIIGGNLKLHVD